MLITQVYTRKSFYDAKSDSNVPPSNTCQSRIDWKKKSSWPLLPITRAIPGPCSVMLAREFREWCKSQPWRSLHSWCSVSVGLLFTFKSEFLQPFLCLYLLFFSLSIRQVTLRLLFEGKLWQTVWLFSSLVFASNSTGTYEMGGVLYLRTRVNSLVRRMLVVWQIM